jgi:hypothetical protein
VLQSATLGALLLDQAFVELARRRAIPRIQERDVALGRELALIGSRFAANGTPRSGQYFVEVLLACAAEADARAQTDWQMLAEVVTTARIEWSHDLADALKSALDSITLPHLYALSEQIRDARERFPHLLNDLHRAISRAREKVRGEVDLFVLGLRHGVDRPGGATATVNAFLAPVSVVQTGANAVALIHVGSREREAIGRALTAIAEGITQAGGRLDGGDAGEVIELTEEVRAEVQKPQPNRLRLGALLTGLATAIQTTASLRPAYEALKAALALAGIPLP